MFGKLQLVFGDRIYSLEPEIWFVALGQTLVSGAGTAGWAAE